MRNFIIKLLGGITKDDCMERSVKAYEEGKQHCRVVFKPLPLPFNEATLQGADYGTFITPDGFATVFGECNVPAPSTLGYEQHAYYVNKDALRNCEQSLLCMSPKVFVENPLNVPDNKLVPVIVTVLR